MARNHDNLVGEVGNSMYHQVNNIRYEQSLICKYQEENKHKINRKNSLEIKKLNEVTEENLDKIFTKSKSSSDNSIDKTVKKYFPDKNKDEIILILNEVLKKYLEEYNTELQNEESD